MIIALAVAALLQADFDTWIVRRDDDAMTDESRLSAEYMTRGGEGLMITCIGDSPAVMRLTRTVVGSDRPVSHGRGFAPAYRFDESEPAVVAWNYSNHGGALLGDDARSFIAAIDQGAGSVLTRMITWDRKTIDQRFPLGGAKDLIAEAVANCP